MLKDYLKAHRTGHFLPRSIDIIIASYCNLWYLVEQICGQPFGTANIEDVLELLEPRLNSTHLINYVNAVTNLAVRRLTILFSFFLIG